MAISTTTAETSQPGSEAEAHVFDNWFDVLESEVRDRVRGFIQTMIEEELEATLMRPRYGRRAGGSGLDAVAAVTGHRHGHRPRTLTGTFGRVELDMPRARLNGDDGRTTEWQSQFVRAYQRRTV